MCTVSLIKSSACQAIELFMYLSQISLACLNIILKNNIYFTRYCHILRYKFKVVENKFRAFPLHWLFPISSIVCDNPDLLLHWFPLCRRGCFPTNSMKTPFCALTWEAISKRISFLFCLTLPQGWADDSCDLSHLLIIKPGKKREKPNKVKSQSLLELVGKSLTLLMQLCVFFL